MHRSARMDITEGGDALVLMDDIRWQFTIDDTFE
jgi:hypothetical protein